MKINLDSYRNRVHSLHFIETSTDNKQIVACYFIDIKKAYDSVNHNLLINKLEIIGIKLTALRLFTNVHQNRRQYVRNEGSNSNNKTMKNGFPQGSMISAP